MQKPLCRMLVVGDDEPERVASILRRSGVDVHVAPTPRDALTFLTDDRPFGPTNPPHAIILDVKTDREPLVREFKNNPLVQPIPIVVFSKDSSPEHRASMYGSGTALFIPKPPDAAQAERVLEGFAAFWCSRVDPPPPVAAWYSHPPPKR